MRMIRSMRLLGFILSLFLLTESIQAQQWTIQYKRCNQKRQSAKAHIERAEGLKQSGNFEEMFTEYREAARIDPKNAAAHHGLAFYYAIKDKHNAVINELRQAIRLGSKDDDTYEMLGNHLFESGRYAEAIAAHREAVRMRPDFAKHYVNLGKALYKSKQKQQAFIQWEKAIKLKEQPAYNEEAKKNAEALLTAMQLLGEYKRRIPVRPLICPRYFSPVRTLDSGVF